MDSRLLAALRKTPAFPDTQFCSDEIDLSNACRAFYQSRLESHKALRERLGSCSYQSDSLQDSQSSLTRSTFTSSSRLGSPLTGSFGSGQGQVGVVGQGQGLKGTVQQREAVSRSRSGGDWSESEHCLKERQPSSDRLGGLQENFRDKNGNCCFPAAKGRATSSIDSAMQLLRQEMASLMEQDLSLMRQLLTLNEEIEELKWRRRYLGWGATSSSSASSRFTAASSYSAFSLMTSSGDGLGASVTSSEGWWGESCGELLPSKYPGVSSLSLQADLGHARLSVYEEGEEQEEEDAGFSGSSTPTGTINRRPLAADDAISDPGLSASQQGTLTRSGGSDSARSSKGCGRHGGFLYKDESCDDRAAPCMTSDPDRGSQPRWIAVRNQSQSKYLTEQTPVLDRESFDSGIHEGYVDTSLPRNNSKTEVTHL